MLTLTEKEAEEVMREIMEGAATPAQIAAYLMGLRLKGETVEEMAGSVRAMRAHAVRITVGASLVVDTCGTGGDGASYVQYFDDDGLRRGRRWIDRRKTRQPVGVVQIGERRRAVGIRREHRPAARPRCRIVSTRSGIGFLFAPLYHGAMKHCAGPRQDMGIRTMLNLLGPLTNPAGATMQVLGVYEPRLTELLGKVLMHLGSQHCFVVHGMDGLDEITLTDRTIVSEAKGGVLSNYVLTPQEFGLALVSPKELAGGSPEDNASDHPRNSTRTERTQARRGLPERRAGPRRRPEGQDASRGVSPRRPGHRLRSRG